MLFKLYLDIIIQQKLLWNVKIQTNKPKVENRTKRTEVFDTEMQK